MKLEDIKDGMLLQVRKGDTYYFIKDMMFYWKSRNIYSHYYIRDIYDNSLKCTCDKDLDIMKIYYMDELIWERGTEWDKVPFGAKVLAWTEDNDTKLEGRLLYYEGDRAELKFLVFMENILRIRWFPYCELLDGGDMVG